MSARLFRYAAGAGVYCAGVGLAYELASPQPDLPSEQSRCSCFKQLSPSYDDEVDATERSNPIAWAQGVTTANEGDYYKFND